MNNNCADYGERVAIVDGLRTPFQKRASGFSELDATALGALCVAELIGRGPVSPDALDRVIFGQVVPSMNDSNIARQVVLRAGLARTTDAHSLSRACTTSYVTAIDAAQAIGSGEADCIVAGGADSMSEAPVAFPAKLTSRLQRASKADSLTERARELGQVGWEDFIPRGPEIADPFTGLRMGDAGEQMAKHHGISRQAQDRFAQRSHRLAAKARDEGRLDEEVMTLYRPPRYDAAVSQDNSLRPESELDDYAKLPPVFDPEYGTLTAANSSPLSDGAAALLMMNADHARALGAPILGYLRAHCLVAVDPEEEMLMGPAYAIPRLLDSVGMAWSDLALLDLHEAFASQILAVVHALESDAFAREKLGRDKAVGEVDWDAFNVNGGSIAFGHPFAATGARQISQTLRELGRRGGGTALCAACAAGGLGAAVILETAS